MCIFACLHVTYVCNFLYMYYVCASIKCQLSIRLPVGPSIRLSACTHIRLSICPSISLCILSSRLSGLSDWCMYVCVSFHVKCMNGCVVIAQKTLFPKAGRLNFFYGQLQKTKKKLIWWVKNPALYFLWFPSTPILDLKKNGFWFRSKIWKYVKIYYKVPILQTS